MTSSDNTTFFRPFKRQNTFEANLTLIELAVHLLEFRSELRPFL